MALEASRLLAPEQVQRLRRKSDLVGALLVLHAWGLVFASMALVVWWPNPLTFVIAVMVIGTRQLGLAILMHDAAHGLLFKSRRLNEGVATWLCAAPVFTSLQLYRPYHLAHHRHTQQPEDPDLGLSAPFPISRRSLWRKIVRDLTGRTAYQRRLEQFRRGLAKEGKAFAANLVLLGALSAIGYWWLYPLLWLLPLATWYQL
ncbi:MAG TPA: fatty acid desaturase family protein, partial [Reyranella sp.]